MKMSDLICRSKLIEEINELLQSPYANQQQFGKERREAIEIVRDLCVKQQPTAYDIDKVVAELEENGSRYTKKYITSYGNNGYRDVKAINIYKAIEIVKRGGVSDDVCECRLLKGHKFLHETSCGDVFDMQNGFKYCPYCGKKIKVVE